MSQPVPQFPNQPLYYQQPPPAPKNPTLHGWLSALVPGLGSMMAGDGAVGVLLLLGIWIFWPIVYLIVTLAAAGLAQASEPIGVMILLSLWGTHLTAYIYGILRGAQAARRWNARHGVFAR